EVQLGQVDALGLRVLRENIRVVAGVEEDTLAAVLYESGIPPVLLHGGRLAEGIIEDGDLRLGGVGPLPLGRGGRPRVSGERQEQGRNETSYRWFGFHSRPLSLRCASHTTCREAADSCTRCATVSA